MTRYLGQPDPADLVEGPLNLHSPVLLRVATTTVDAGAKKFVARDCLASANIGELSEDFAKFLNEVEDVESIVIESYNLEYRFDNESVYRQLGDCSEIKMGHLFALIERQSHGEEGFLQVNGDHNQAYVLDSDGRPWCVLADWLGDFGYWCLFAFEVSPWARDTPGVRILRGVKGGR